VGEPFFASLLDTVKFVRANLVPPSKKLNQKRKTKEKATVRKRRHKLGCTQNFINVEK
jgi:hypothetical protein